MMPPFGVGDETFAYLTVLPEILHTNLLIMRTKVSQAATLRISGFLFVGQFFRRQSACAVSVVSGYRL